MTPGQYCLQENADDSLNYVLSLVLDRSREPLCPRQSARTSDWRKRAIRCAGAIDTQAFAAVPFAVSRSRASIPRESGQFDAVTSGPMSGGVVLRAPSPAGSEIRASFLPQAFCFQTRGAFNYIWVTSDYQHGQARARPQLGARSHYPLPAGYRFLQTADAAVHLEAFPPDPHFVYAAEPHHVSTAWRDHRSRGLCENNWTQSQNCASTSRS